MDGSTHLGKIQKLYGGVGRNISEALGLLGHRPLFLSVVGDDASGKTMIDAIPSVLSILFFAFYSSKKVDNFFKKFQDVSLVARLRNFSTASYSLILDKKGECLFGVGDMEIHNNISKQYVSFY